MSVVEHELKRHEMWREELRKKNKAYILFSAVLHDGYFSSFPPVSFVGLSRNVFFDIFFVYASRRQKMAP